MKNIEGFSLDHGHSQVKVFGPERVQRILSAVKGAGHTTGLLAFYVKPNRGWHGQVALFVNEKQVLSASYGFNLKIRDRDAVLDAMVAKFEEVCKS
jgi:hypothetical protein